MVMRDYKVRYETYEGIFEFKIRALGPSEASDACFYEHGDEPGYNEIAVIRMIII